MIRPFIISYLFIITRPHRDFFLKNNAFQLINCHYMWCIAQFEPHFSHISWTTMEECLKLPLFHEYFSRFLNCTNGTKSRSASHITKNQNCYFLIFWKDKVVRAVVLFKLCQNIIFGTFFISAVFDTIRPKLFCI